MKKQPERRREVCQKKKCGKVATVVVKVYTTEEPAFFAICHGHLRTAIAVLRGLQKCRI